MMMAKEQHKIVLLSGAGKKGNAHVHSETPTKRANTGHSECWNTQIRANDTSYWKNQRSKVHAEGAVVTRPQHQRSLPAPGFLVCRLFVQLLIFVSAAEEEKILQHRTSK